MLLSCGLELQLMRMFGGCCTASNQGCSLIDLSRRYQQTCPNGYAAVGAFCCVLPLLTVDFLLTSPV